MSCTILEQPPVIAISANPAKLVDSGKATHNRVIANLDVPRESSVVGENNRITYHAIVTDVAVGEIIPFTADARFSRAGGAAIDGDEFAKTIFIANFEISWFALIFQILRLLTYRTVRVKLVPSACRRRPANGDMMLQPTLWAEEDPRLHNAIRADYRPVAYFCFWINDGGWMNLHLAH